MLQRELASCVLLRASKGAGSSFSVRATLLGCAAGATSLGCAAGATTLGVLLTHGAGYLMKHVSGQ